MSDLQITGGGVVSVDTASLEQAARTLDDLRAEVAGAAESLRGAAVRIGGVLDMFDEHLAPRAWSAVRDADRLDEQPRRLADWLRETAAMYEVVELRAERAVATATGDAASVDRIDARIDAIDAQHPWTSLHATFAEAWRGATWPADLAAQLDAGFWMLGPAAAAGIGLTAWGLAASLPLTGAGRVAPGARLSGVAESVRLREVALPATATPPAAPATLAAAARRIPDGAARIRVETYSMPDGSRQFAVYVAGTRDGKPGGPDPYDWKSNAELFTGETSASYDSVVQALRDAGAGPGDVVHAFGHSQGALIEAHLAAEGGFDTRTLVGFGSPVTAELGPDTLSVSVRHTDDPVAALAGGGTFAPVGAPGSFVAERTIDPLPGTQDLGLVAHAMDGYVDTAALLDGSSDPRMDAVRATLAELGSATSVTVAEYDAVRVSSSSGGGE